MSKVLILTEKPSLGKKVAAALGVKKKNKNGNFEENDIIIVSLVGHVIEAKYPKKSWDIKNLPLKFDNIKMIPSKGKKDLVTNIKKEISRKDISEIVNCGDADPEGSLLVYELLEYFNLVEKDSKHQSKVKNINFTRMWILAEDKKTIKKAYDERFSQEKDMVFVNTAKSRAEADVEIGFNFSQLFTLKVGEFDKTMNIGRVMTPTMGIVREREKEIEKFIPEEYWNVKGTFRSNGTSIVSDCFVINDEGKQTTALKKDKYEPIKPLIKKGNKYKVKSNSSKLNSKKPDYLPNLNDILKSCGTLFKLSSKKTTDIMQTLYEAQYCTYPRSESKFLPTSMEDDIKKIYNTYTTQNKSELNGETTSFSVKNKRIFDDTKVESHFAIIPLVKSDKDIQKLGQDERNVFNYIVAKFLMAFMKDYKYDSSVIVLEDDNKITFKTTGQVEKQKGFKAYDFVSNKSKKGDVILPELEEGEELVLDNVKIKKDATKPPATMTETGLLEIMGDVHKLYKKQKEEGLEEEEEVELAFDSKFSLGTSATRGGILDKLFKIKFLERKGQKVQTSDIGKELLNVVGNAVGIETTAQFEEQMANITAGKSKPEDFIKSIKSYVREVIEKEKPKIKQNSTSEKKETDLKCTLCNSMLTENHKGYRCSECGTFDKKTKKFSGCAFGIIKYQKPLNYTLKKEDVERLLKKETLEIEGNKIDLDLSSPFFTKITYSGQTKQEQLSVKCPSCNGEIVQSPKLFRCKNTGKWNPKKKSWDGDCDFTQFKYIKQLGKEIKEEELKQLIEGKELVNGDKKFKRK